MEPKPKITTADQLSLARLRASGRCTRAHVSRPTGGISLDGVHQQVGPKTGGGKPD